MAILGLRILGYKTLPLKRSFSHGFFQLIWLSIALGFLFSFLYESSYLYPGGKYGYTISGWLSSLIGGVGTLFLLLGTFLTYLLVGFEGTSHKIHELFRRNAEKRAARLKVKEQEKEKQKLAKEELVDFNTILNEETSDNEPEKTASVTETSNPEFSKEEPAPQPPVLTNEIDFTQLEADDKNNEKEEDPESTPTPAANFTFDLNSEEDFISEKTMKPEKEENNQNEPELIVNPDSSDDYPEPEEIETDRFLEDYDPTLDLSHYEYPPFQLLEAHNSGIPEVTQEELLSNKKRIVETLRNYKIEITSIKATTGPTVTLYEIKPAPGVRISKIKNLEDDIALSLAALGIRIIAPIPGKGTIGIEVPNLKPEIVSMRSIIESENFQECKYDLPIALGKTISNDVFITDLAKMPHILVAGATGQGKSVGLNAIISSLLFKKHPSQLKFVFVDPKKVELNLYSVIERHFLAKMPTEEDPIITDVQKVKATLNSVNVEMDLRYDLLKKAHSRNIKEYNHKFITRKLNPEKGHRYLPYIVVVVDEFADLIMTAGKEIEIPIARIAQLARAVGIHMIIATQRPSTNIITGVIKANFPARIAFKVASMIDSRTILDSPGANQLIGKGDMLIDTGSKLTRVQCAFVDTPEVEAICQHIAQQQAYPTAFLLPEYSEEGGADGIGENDLENRDELFDQVARMLVMNQTGSTSAIQRKFSIGYNRAGRIMDQLEAAGIVGPNEGSKARTVMIQDEYSLEQILKSL